MGAPIPLPLTPPVASDDTDCSTCAWREDCGGLGDLERYWGCFTQCGPHCRNSKCDWTCIERLPEFLHRFRSVGGMSAPVRTLLPLSAELRLGPYLTMIHHGNSHVEAFPNQLVALPLLRVMKKRGSDRYGRSLPGAAALRAEFGLRPDARVLLISVGKDRLLEQFWHDHQTHDAASQIAELGVIGMTVPNFSYFTDAPRTHVLWNRRRMIRVAERLSAAGVPVVPHLNALTPADWAFWAGLLKDQPGIRHVAKEFQTGLSLQDKGREAIEDLRRLQGEVGRPLHPILIGGARYIADICDAFVEFTVVDSTPFMRSVMRRSLDIVQGKPRWEKVRSSGERPIDDLLFRNAQRYEKWLTDRLSRDACPAHAQDAAEAVPSGPSGDACPAGLGQLLLPMFANDGEGERR